MQEKTDFCCIITKLHPYYGHVSLQYRRLPCRIDGVLGPRRQMWPVFLSRGNQSYFTQVTRIHKIYWGLDHMANYITGVLPVTQNMALDSCFINPLRLIENEINVTDGFYFIFMLFITVLFPTFIYKCHNMIHLMLIWMQNLANNISHDIFQDIWHSKISILQNHISLSARAKRLQRKRMREN